MLARRLSPIRSLVPLLGLIVGCQTAPGGAGSYSRGEALRLRPIPSVRDPFAGTTVVTAAFPCKSLSQYEWLGNASTDYAAEFLLEAGFQPLEGADGDLKKILEEIEFGNSDAVDVSSANEIGKQTGARYIFTGAVTDYSKVEGDGSQNGALQGLGLGFGVGNSYIELSVQVSGRLIDISSRRILASKTASFSHRFEAQGGALETPWGTFGKQQTIEVTNETGGKIVQLCMNQLVAELVEQLNAGSGAGEGKALP